MTFVWIATFHGMGGQDRQLSESDMERLVDLVKSTPGLSHGLVHTPWEVSGLYYDDGPAPSLVVHLHFQTIAALENNLSASGHLQRLAETSLLPSLGNVQATEQAMVARSFPVPSPAQSVSEGQPFCTYLVHYPGPADDLNAWLQHYLDHHAPVMQRFPDVRAVEVCTRLDWCSAMPWKRVHHMQRNKVVFDHAEALKAALSSPVMLDMRADLGNFPAFSGGNAHYPMSTLMVTPQK